MKLKFTGEELANHAEARCAYHEQRVNEGLEGSEGAAAMWAVVRDHIDRGADYELTLEDIERLEFGQ